MKTKLYHLIIAVILSATSLQAQGQYFVYSITGTASVLRNNKPQPLKILDKVLELESIYPFELAESHLEGWPGSCYITPPPVK